MLIVTLYVIILISGTEGKIHTIGIISLTLSGFVAGTRAFLYDRLKRVVENKEIVNFWKYLEDTDSWTQGVQYFLIIPVFQKLDGSYENKLKFRINSLTIVFYIEFLVFIWTQLGRRWHQL